jgi:hypothetical protein
VVASVPNTNSAPAAISRVYSDPFGSIRGGSDAGVPGDHRFLCATRDYSARLDPATAASTANTPAAPDRRAGVGHPRTS